MAGESLIYTNEKCIGCNKCISVCSCPGACVSVDKDGENHIEVDGDKCAACGACFDVCEHGAREFHDDTERFFADLQRGEKISLLVAPAFPANYPEEYGSVLGGLKALGANHIISVAFGADITTWGYLNYIKEHDFVGGISQPCPAVVGYIERHLPELIPRLFPVQSPLMCAAIYARREMGITDKLAFISPCIAKKLEIDDPNNHGYVSYNVTFEHLMRYVREHNISGPFETGEIESGLGSIYPMPGGLKENVCWFLGEEVFIRQVEGEKHLYHYLEKNRQRIEKGATSYLFIDALNCSSGCIYGTGCEEDKIEDDQVLENLLQIREDAKKEGTDSPWGRELTPEQRLAELNRQFAHLNLTDYLREYTDLYTEFVYPTDAERQAIFTEMKKLTYEDQHINCSSCGYESCYQMTEAIHNGFNKKENCIYYMKKIIEEQRDAAEQAKVEIEQASRMKSDFLANMSHEIRTPMNAVIGMTEMALREKLSPDARDYMHQIKSSGRELLAIINDILDFSKIESGKMDIIPVEYETMSIINDVVNIIMTRIKNKDIELILDLDTDIPRMVLGDNIRIKQVLINLANNAVKFTDHGRVRVKFHYERLDEKNLDMQIAVEDTGIGIRPEDLDKLFASFQQVDSKRNRNIEGTGLGLAISRQLMLLMGGEVSVASTYGEGSTFSFHFPQPIVDEKPSIFVSEPEKKSVASVIASDYVREQLKADCKRLSVSYRELEQPEEINPAGLEEGEHFLILDKACLTPEWEDFARNHSQMKTVLLVDFFDTDKYDTSVYMVMKKPLYALNLASLLNGERLHYEDDEENVYKDFTFVAPEADVLIVDDNAVNLTVAEGILKPLQLRTQTAQSGREAIEKIEMYHFDMVFMDHMMPEMDGIEATHLIRQLDSPNSKVPIIALSANAVEGARDMFLKEGMDDFVSKPIEMRAITEKVKQWLPEEKIQPVDQADLEAAETEEEIEIGDLNVKEAVKLLGSREMFFTVLKTYYRAIEKSADSIARKKREGDWKGYTIEVHALKSSSKQIGAMVLSQEAARLEAAGNKGDIDAIHRDTDRLLAHYRSYIPLLAPYCAEPEAEPAAKEEITGERLQQFFADMREAADNLDLDSMEKVGEAMRGYAYPAAEEEFLHRLLQAVEDIDTDACCEIVDEWEQARLS